MADHQPNQVKKDKLPTVHAFDVEFSIEEADQEDMEAVERAKAAEKRQENL